MIFYNRLLKIFFTSLIVNILALEFSVSIAHKNINLAMGLALLLPFMNLMNTFAILESKTTKERIIVSFVCSISLSLSVYLVLEILGR
jgi:predicted branched-subunit amino acid permease